MKHPSDLMTIADDRLEEADYLLQGNFFEGAMYLAGYSLELLLKAKICQLLDIPNLFDDDFPGSVRDVSGLNFKIGGEFRKFFLVHDIAKLFLLTGLRTKFDTDKATNKQLMNAWTCICDANWSEQYRYFTRNQKTDFEARNFIDAIKVFRAWILTN